MQEESDRRWTTRTPVSFLLIESTILERVYERPKKSKRQIANEIFVILLLAAYRNFHGIEGIHFFASVTNGQVFLRTRRFSSFGSYEWRIFVVVYKIANIGESDIGSDENAILGPRLDRSR